MGNPIRRMNFNRLPFGLLHLDGAIEEAARLVHLARVGIGRVYGPRVYTRKNIGRGWRKGARSNRYRRPHAGAGEAARSKRQITAGQLRAENGLVSP